MKVKDLIAQLQELDPERNIWIIYDGFDVTDPEFLEITENDVEYFDEGPRAGDYAHFAG